MERNVASRIELNASPHCRGYVIRRIPQASHSPNTHAQNARTLSGGGRRRQEQSLSVSTPRASSDGVGLASGLIYPTDRTMRVFVTGRLRPPRRSQTGSVPLRLVEYLLNENTKASEIVSEALVLAGCGVGFEPTTFGL